MEDTNTQAQPSTPPAPPAGKTMEEVLAENESLKRESEGRLRDLQTERSKRQELETRLTPPAPSADQNDVPQDELGKVLKPYIDPILRRTQAAEAFVATTLQDKALDHLASKTGKSKQQLLEDRDFQSKMVNVQNRYGFTGNVYDITVKAYEVLELEGLRAAEQERQRQAAANSVGSMPSGNASAPANLSGKEWSSKAFADMANSEYEQYASKGTFRQGDNGNIVFVPRA